MDSKITLLPHQQKVVEESRPRLLLAHSTGTGKTITSISLVNKNCGSVLVVCPKILVPKWEQDIKTFLNKGILYMVLSKEQFKIQVDSIPGFECVIVDEAHYFAGLKSQLSKALFFYLQKYNVKYRYLCTATPYLSTPMNIYTLARHLGYEWDYWRFFHTFFYNINMGGKKFSKVKVGIEPEIAKLVSEIGSVVDMAEVVEVPEQIVETVFLKMTKEQLERYKSCSDLVFIKEWTNKHLVENGIVRSEDETKHIPVNNEKLDYIKKIVSKEKKVAIFCRYLTQVYEIEKEIKKLGKFTIILHGGISDRYMWIKKAEELDECVIIIQAQCSSGYELPSFGTIIFASLSFSYVDYEQAMGRFLRINRLKPNRYIHLVVGGGVDEDVYKCIMKKQDFSIEIYNR